ncbi:MAG TPA: tail fiber protein [Phnomibacter sp.]|nr:tail fiber protein [Phnomibacter sp.]
MPGLPLLSEIYMGGMNFAPSGYAACSGQLLPISSNTALFSLLGTNFGGNGTTNFALPDLRGRVPMGFGNGPGFTPRTIGEQDGAEMSTLTIAEMPSHTHTLNAVNVNGNSNTPGANNIANTGTLDKEFKSTGTLTNMQAGAIGNNGGSVPHSNLQPYLVVTFYIATQGVFPQRP